METLNFKSNYYILKETGNNIKWHFPFRRVRACKEITCSMNFKKQRPNPPFFFEKEQVISLLRLSFRSCHQNHLPSFVSVAAGKTNSHPATWDSGPIYQ